MAQGTPPSSPPSLTRAIGSALNRDTGLGPILQQCAEAFVEHFGHGSARIWTLDARAQRLELQASAGLEAGGDGYTRVDVGRFVIGRIAEDRQPRLNEPIDTGLRAGDPTLAPRDGLVALAAFPLVRHKQVVGVLAICGRERFSAEALEAMAFVADSIARVIERRRAEGPVPVTSLRAIGS